MGICKVHALFLPDALAGMARRGLQRLPAPLSMPDAPAQGEGQAKPSTGLPEPPEGIPACLPVRGLPDGMGTASG